MYSEEDIKQLLNEITRYYGLWKPIGLELGIDVNVISNIERDYKGDSNRLQALIKKWPHSDNSSIAFKTLLKACESERVSSALEGMYISSIKLSTIVSSIIPRVSMQHTHGCSSSGV